MKKIILPLDGYPCGREMLEKLRELLGEPDLAELLAFIKVNDGVHNKDFGGPEMVREIKHILSSGKHEIGVFLDLKIFDVSETLKNTLKKYIEYPPEILTVSSSCSVSGVVELRKLLPKSVKLAMVSVLTDISVEECLARFGQSPEVKIYNDLMNFRAIYRQQIGTYEGWDDQIEPFDLVVCSPRELTFLKRNLPEDYGFIVPGIRDEWMKKANEHQKRIMGAKEALDLGATFLVMGAQMVKGNPGNGVSPEQSRQMTKEQISLAKPRFDFKAEPLSLLKACNGYYKSPVDEKGKSIGPLMGYAGKYKAVDGSEKNYIGFEYFNFSRAETEPSVRAHFAALIGKALKKAGIKYDSVLGAPMGGILLAGSIGDHLGCRTIFAEKEVVGVMDKVKGIKEISRQIIDRHEIFPGDGVVIVEDVCNNFSTSEKLQNLIEEHGGHLVAIVCAFNRSGKDHWNDIPVISAQFIPTEQFLQSDETVSDLLQAGNIIWNPKKEWLSVLEAMRSK